MMFISWVFITNQNAFPVSINNLFDPRLRDMDPGMHGSPSLEISGCTTIRHQDHHFCGAPGVEYSVMTASCLGSENSIFACNYTKFRSGSRCSSEAGLICQSMYTESGFVWQFSSKNYFCSFQPDSFKLHRLWRPIGAIQWREGAYLFQWSVGSYLPSRNFIKCCQCGLSQFGIPNFRL